MRLALENFIDTEELALVASTADVASIIGLPLVAALAYLMFNLFTPPCFAAIGAMNSKMEDRKWLWGRIAFQFGMGYSVAFVTYQMGTLLTTGAMGTGFLPGLAAFGLILVTTVYLMRKGDAKAQYMVLAKAS